MALAQTTGLYEITGLWLDMRLRLRLDLHCQRYRKVSSRKNYFTDLPAYHQRTDPLPMNQNSSIS